MSAFIEQWKLIGQSYAVAYLMRRELADPSMCRGGIASVVQRDARKRAIIRAVASKRYQ